MDIIRAIRAQYQLGTELPWVLVEEDNDGGAEHGGGRIVGTITLTGIVHGPFLSANLGHWVDRELNGRGIGSAAVRFAVGYAQQELGPQPREAGVRGLNRYGVVARQFAC
ncbi:GNAT family N-acetyltransferase [Pseudarthrobacter sp. NS4]|uniref:GNAT family N-acetyltransferase n=1 Tax=Pseudarthrobacter sp. NS4 TaxID=2973976 RepID=UPI002161107C|nr:GNAT family protein [Pseudarthrobacter sp. NS4]